MWYMGAYPVVGACLGHYSIALMAGDSHSSVVQGSTAYSNNPGVLLQYQTSHCGTDIKSASLKVASFGILASFFLTSSSTIILG